MAGRGSCVLVNLFGIVNPDFTDTAPALPRNCGARFGRVESRHFKLQNVIGYGLSQSKVEVTKMKILGVAY